MAGDTEKTAPEKHTGDSLATEAARRRKLRDAALAAPLFGVFLLCSPLMDIVAGAGAIYGVPFDVIYIFGVWGGLILVTALLAHRLSGPDGG